MDTKLSVHVHFIVSVTQLSETKELIYSLDMVRLRNSIFC